MAFSPTARAEVLAAAEIAASTPDHQIGYIGYLHLIRMTGDADSLREIRRQAYDDKNLSGGQIAVILQTATEKIEDLGG